MNSFGFVCGDGDVGCGVVVLDSLSDSRGVVEDGYDDGVSV